MNWTEGPIKDVIIRKLQKHSDQRGFLAEIWRQDTQEFPDPKMGYMSFRKYNSKTPIHEHNEQTDLMLFPGIGRFKVRLWDNRKDSLTYGNMTTFTIKDHEPVLVLIPSHVAHSYKVLSVSGAWVFNFPNRLYKGEFGKEEVDEIRWEEREDNPFFI